MLNILKFRFSGNAGLSKSYFVLILPSSLNILSATSAECWLVNVSHIKSHKHVREGGVDTVLTINSDLYSGYARGLRTC